MLAALRQTLELEFCTVLALRHDEDKLDCVASAGFSEGFLGSRALAAAGSLGGYALSGSQPVVVENFATETRFKRSPTSSPPPWNVMAMSRSAGEPPCATH